jgi:dihydrofolate synthase/folylpolyglutamate synthase
MGGRDDATNALDPELSVITSLGPDHVRELGGSLQSIAAHKIEIARTGRPMVLPREMLAMPAIAQRLKQIGCNLVPFETTGTFEDNQSVISVVSAQLGRELTTVRTIQLPGRQERLDKGAGIILDGAHNEPAWRALVAWYQARYRQPRAVLCSLGGGRDPHRFVSLLAPIARGFHVWPTGAERELPFSAWPQKPAISAVTTPRLAALLDEPLLVCGSLYTVGAFRRWLTSRTMIQKETAMA